MLADLVCERRADHSTWTKEMKLEKAVDLIKNELDEMIKLGFFSDKKKPSYRETMRK